MLHLLGSASTSCLPGPAAVPACCVSASTGGGGMHNAIDSIVGYAQSKLHVPELCKMYRNLSVVKHSTLQISGIHTLIHDRDLPASDFVFHYDRLSRLVIEHGLERLPFTYRDVFTPAGSVYEGVEFCRKICGVSINKSGESMENALRTCFKEIMIGKIIISNAGDNVIYENLPTDISEFHVLLLHPVLDTDNATNQAIELLISKGVSEEKILILNLIAAHDAIHNVCKRFQYLHIVTSEIGSALDLGDFVSRYFGF